MSSDKSEDEHDTISKQIVEYYKKYSQSRHLPKYFSGSPLSYMPPIVKEHEIAPLIVIEDTTLISKPPEDIKPASPTSSITSNRKLEWDNGADIGYNNCHKPIKLQKSVSLPLLLTDEEKGTKEGPQLCTQVVTVISYPGSDDPITKDTQSSSSSPSVSAKAPITSSSSSVKTNPKIASTSSSSFTSTIAYLKRRIGLPEAESTPKLGAHTHGRFKKRLVSLCVTKPILIECAGARPKQSSHKLIQTSLSLEQVSKSIQTSLEVLTEKAQIEPPKPENQSVILINYDSESERQTYSSNTQTDAEVIASQCDSFEYYKNENRVKKNSDSSSSKELPVLAQLISEKQSKTLIGDVDRSIELLQKLLKSKKYDPETKKRYIKKIVQKIVDSKYNEDSTSSSELFVPKPQSRLSVKTFRDEFLPQKSIFVMSHSEAQKPTPESSLEKQQSFNSYQSWKEDKTASERLLEEKQKGQGDHIVRFAKKERQHQLAWIKDEISHLTKLKGLLEKRVQTTTVYMVSKPECHPCCPSQSSSTRSYVIETDLTGSSESSNVPTTYNLRDKSGKFCYQVRKPEDVVQPKMVGEIQVESDDKMTNINVKTKRVDDQNREGGGFRPPALVGSGKYDTFPRSKTEEERPCRCPLYQGKKEFTLNNRLSFEIPLVPKKTSNIDNPTRPVEIQSLRSSEDPNTKVLTVVDPKQTCYCCGRKKRRSFELPDHFTYCLCKKNQESSTKPEMPDYPKFQGNLPCICGKHQQIPRHPIFKPCICDHLDKNLETTGQLSDQKNQNVCSDTSDRSSHRTKSKSVRSETSDQKKYETRVPCDPCNSKAPEIADQKNRKSSFAQSDRFSIQKNFVCPPDQQNRKFSYPQSTDRFSDQHTRKFSLPADQKNLKCFCPDADQKRFADKTSDSDATKTCELICIESNDESPTNLTEYDSENVTKKSKPVDVSCQCSFVEPKPLRCACTKVQTDPVETTSMTTTKKNSTIESFSSSSSRTTSSGTTGSLTSCICCKRQNVTSQRLYRLKQKLSDQAYPLCRPCYRQNRPGCSPTFYSNPGHVCNCYTVVQTDTLNQIKKTINDLNEMGEYCTCNNSDSGGSSQYCKYCKCKLKKTSKSRNGIAYMLTFENEPVKEKKKKRKRHALEEIKIKIPVVTKKKHKEKANKKKKERVQEMDEESSSQSPKRGGSATLQDYLCLNRPKFVQCAEGRRNVVNDSRSRREEMSDYNKLEFLKKCQAEGAKNSRPLFSGKEMKEINRRNYKKLPEVQQKLNDNKERQLRQASRLMADAFNRKLRENVLKGKKDLPINCKVVCM